MLPMLHFDPEQRATAAEMLRHPWLEGPSSAAAAAADGDNGRRQPGQRSSSAPLRDHSADWEEKRVRYNCGCH